MKMLAVGRFVTVFVCCFSLLLPILCPAQDTDALAEIAVARGIDHLNEGQALEAIKSFEEALKINPLEPEALYFSGLAHIRVGQLKEAEEKLLKLEKSVGPSPEIYKELALLYQKMEQPELSLNYLNEFMKIADNDAETEQIKKALEEAHGRKIRPWSAQLALGVENDSNVIIEPDNPDFNAGAESDVRVVGYLAVDWEALKKEAFEVVLDYVLYQSIHQDLDSYDLQSHAFDSRLKTLSLDPAQASIGYGLEYILLGRDEYSSRHQVTTELFYGEEKSFKRKLQYTYGNSSYRNTDRFVANSDLSGSDHALGWELSFLDHRSQLDVYGSLEIENAEEDYWSHDGYRLGVKYMRVFQGKLFLQLTAEYNERRYDEFYPGLDKARDDELLTLLLNLTYALPRDVAVTLTGGYYDNQSNLDIFEYDREIVGLYLSKMVF